MANKKTSTGKQTKSAEQPQPKQQVADDGAQDRGDSFSNIDDRGQAFQNIDR